MIVGRFLALEKMVGDYLYKCGQEVVGEEVFSQFYRYVKYILKNQICATGYKSI